MSRVVFVAAPLSQLRQHFLQCLQRQHHGTAELDETGACLRRVLRVPGQPILGGALIITRVIPAVALSRSDQCKTDAPTRHAMKEEEKEQRRNGICARMWSASVSATLPRLFAFRGTLGCA